MRYKKPRSGGKNPESKLYEAIRDHLRGCGWFVQNIHGNRFQSGLPDLYCHIREFPHRWVEIKTPNRSRERHGGLSDRQLAKFREMSSHGIGIWIITSVEECKLLYGDANWRQYAFGSTQRNKKPKGF